MFRSHRAAARFCALFAMPAVAWPSGVSAQAEALRSPFTAAVQGARHDAVATSSPCAAATVPVHDVFGVSYYTDAHHSVADPQKRARNVAQLQPVRDYLRGVTELVDAAVRGDRAAGRCAWVWFHTWSEASALDGKVNNQGAYEREWTLGGLALAYLKLRDTGIDDPAARPGVVIAWLAKLARIVEPPYDGPRASRNNHAYWTGLAVAASGIAANDRALFDWGVAKYRVGADEIAPDGTLPLEMARGERALHYHFYALTPLVMLAELGRANG
jgi:poly(beta-D-mannuronate) lyase